MEVEVETSNTNMIKESQEKLVQILRSMLVLLKVYGSFIAVHLSIYLMCLFYLSILSIYLSYQSIYLIYLSTICLINLSFLSFNQSYLPINLPYHSVLSIDLMLLVYFINQVHLN